MPTQLEDLYERDVVAWTTDQAAALRRLAEGRWNGPLDLLHLAAEIESMGNEIAFGVLSQVERMILHLLKLEHSSSPMPRRSWIRSIDDARKQIDRRLTATIRARVEAELDDLYATAARAARLELLDHHERQAADALPPTCPYALNQLLTERWYPSSRHGLVDDV